MSKNRMPRSRDSTFQLVGRTHIDMIIVHIPTFKKRFRFRRANKYFSAIRAPLQREVNYIRNPQIIDY